MIFYFSNELRLALYGFMLMGLLLQSQVTVMESFRKNELIVKLREIVFLTIQLIIITLTTYYLSMLTVTGISPFSRYLFVLIIIFFMIFARTLIKGKNTLEKMNDEITPFSIVESLDTLNSGMIVYEKNGQIVLVNEKMNEITKLIFNKEYLNGKFLWNDINNSTNKKISQDLNAIIIEKNGIAYDFTRNKIMVHDNIYQELIASDVTEIYKQLSVIENINQELEDSYKAVDEMLGNIDKIVDIEEKIKMKVHLHDSLGHQFTLLRSLVNNYEKFEDNQELIKPLEILDNLTTQPDYEPEERLKDVQNFFANIGIDINIEKHSNIPEKLENVFILIAIEGITNAIIHGDAKNIYIRYCEGIDEYCMTLENDGISSGENLVEGGGIRGMRFRLKPFKGELEVYNTYPFKIIVKVDKNY